MLSHIRGCQLSEVHGDLGLPCSTEEPVGLLHVPVPNLPSNTARDANIVMRGLFITQAEIVTRNQRLGRLLNKKPIEKDGRLWWVVVR